MSGRWRSRTTTGCGSSSSSPTTATRRCAPTHPEVPAEHAILGVEGARAYIGRGADADRELLTETLGFTELGDGEYRLDGDDAPLPLGL